MNTKDLLKIFNLRDIEIRLFEVLFHHPPLRAGDLAKKSGLSRTSVYDLLEKLIEQGLVYETLKDGIKIFTAQRPAKIKLLVSEKEKELEVAKRVLVNLETDYQKLRTSLEPRMQLFEGRQQLHQMMKDLLLYPSKTVRAYWPIEEIMKILTPEFFQEFQEKRLKENIRLKTIWPEKQIPSFKRHPFLAPKKELIREVRLAPGQIDFSLGYAVYGSTTRFISSSHENFGFLIESQELAEMMTTQFELIWAIAKPLKAQKHKI